jgi:hypothetical protein
MSIGPQNVVSGSKQSCVKINYVSFNVYAYLWLALVSFLNPLEPRGALDGLITCQSELC